jgi:hypothetical protein
MPFYYCRILRLELIRLNPMPGTYESWTSIHRNKRAPSDHKTESYERKIVCILKFYVPCTMP